MPAPDKELTVRIGEELQKSNTQEIKLPINKRADELNRQICKTTNCPELFLKVFSISSYQGRKIKTTSPQVSTAITNNLTTNINIEEDVDRKNPYSHFF